jgi:hypothetical protein
MGESSVHVCFVTKKSVKLFMNHHSYRCWIHAREGVCE